MVILNTDIQCIAVLPSKHDAPLVVYPDRVLPCAIAFQLFKSIARRREKVLDRLRVVEHPELPQSRLLHFPGETLVELPQIDALGLLGGEGLDHKRSI